MSEHASARILLIEDETVLTASLAQHLCAENYSVEVAETASQAENLFSNNSFDIVLLSLQLTDVDSFELLKKLKEISSSTEIIALTNYGTISRAIEAVKAGAFFFVEKPFDFAELLPLIERALEHRALIAQNESLNRQFSTRTCYQEIIGASKKMQTIYETIELVAKTDAPILIVGESGTGKELIANAIHHNSHRAQKPLIKVNCAAMPKELFESELFGHREEAHPLAHADKRGLVQYADSGSLLLDEISEIPFGLQPKVLKFLKENQYSKFGCDEMRDVDVRLIATTLSETLLPEDLFNCLSTVMIHVPPLRERSDDIGLLAENFLKLYATKHERNVCNISSESYEILFAHNWSGNVRELQNVIERAVLLAKSETIEPTDLPFDGKQNGSSYQIPADITLEEMEKLVITKTLQRTLGNKQAAAQLLGIYRPRLYSKIKKYGIDMMNLSSSD